MWRGGRGGDDDDDDDYGDDYDDADDCDDAGDGDGIVMATIWDLICVHTLPAYYTTSEHMFFTR